MTDKPLLLILLTVAPGIFAGSYWFGAISLTLTLTLTLSLVLASLVCSLVFPSRNAVSSAFLLLASFFLGMMLVTNSIQRGSTPTVSLPFIDEMEEYMSGKREAMLQTYRDAGLNEDVYGVVAAMTLGERSAVSQPLKSAYNVSGVSHVFALSGMHLAIIFGFISLMLPVRIFPRSSALVQILFLWSFVFLVGIHPSILRAAVMFTFYALCRILSRAAQSIDVLILTAFLLLVFNPQWLFDVGFQMSFMAMVGILLLCGRLQRLVRAPRSYLVGILAVTLSANLGTLPLIALYFGRVSCYGLLANLVVSPCTFLILLLSLTLQVLSIFLCANSTIVHFTVQILNGTVSLMNSFVRWLSSLPGASIEGISLTASQTILVYVVIAAIILVARHVRHGLRLRLHD